MVVWVSWHRQHLHISYWVWILLQHVIFLIFLSCGGCSRLHAYQCKYGSNYFGSNSTFMQHLHESKNTRKNLLSKLEMNSDIKGLKSCVFFLKVEKVFQPWFEKEMLQKQQKSSIIKRKTSLFMRRFIRFYNSALLKHSTKEAFFLNFMEKIQLSKSTKSHTIKDIFS